MAKMQPTMIYGPLNEMAWLDRGQTPGEWTLKHGDRVRWGTSKEIREDIDHFEWCGKLPDRTGSGF